MAKVSSKSASKRKNGGRASVELPTFSENLLLIRKSGKPAAAKLRANESTQYLLKEIVKSRPKISREAIFYSRLGKKVDAFFVSPDDPTKIVRERADGSRVLGRLVDGRFRASSAK